jgi:hypothetical protein
MDIKTFSHSEKKDIVKKIEKLTLKSQYKQIFKILKMSNIKVTQNNNGIFFNMNDLDNSTLIKMNEYLDSIINKPNNSIDIKYYNDLIMNNTTTEMDFNKQYIDYNNDSNNNDSNNNESTNNDSNLGNLNINK